ncbi:MULTISPECIES: hypothetical protein [unclassified Pantoea]|uniref:hypothetical protein n=1 Tax=unclassified Pantoea TaxID=2630326 RepID=UPI001CD765F5|nr:MULTISPECIES: hypothetical protein [unclassified Pantoea]MCA1178726.1 hypothetical protein [Pantoea sp. alder69]MCA1251087.1 hypothetical protein [Pantoea sp. alder70]MCA1267215.1 hypothetical protein [Pantoea sp. alder81]
MANTFKRSTSCLLVSLTLLLGGCANTGSSLLSGTKPDPRLTSGEQSQLFSSSAAQGCGVGALAGAGLGALTGALAGNGKKALVGAAVGGAAGCAAGVAANYYLDSLKKDYATTADRLQAMDKDINKDTADIAKTTAAMKAVIHDNSATLTKISVQKDKAGFDKAGAKKELAQIDANVSVMKDKIKVMKEKSDGYKFAISGQTTSNAKDKAQLTKLKTEYNELNNQITVLESETDGLYSQRQAISLG